MSNSTHIPYREILCFNQTDQIPKVNTNNDTSSDFVFDILFGSKNSNILLI